jgi:outer membrane receptor protein involved in Fe transport
LVNGMRVCPPGGEDMMLRSDFSIRMAERIEIIYGPGSMVYGEDAVSGVVNVITEKSEFGQAVGNFGQDGFYEGFTGVSRKIGGTEDDPIIFSAYFFGTDSNLTDLSKAYPDWWARYNASHFGAPESPVRWDQGYNIFGRIENKNNSVQMWYRTSSRSSAEGGFPGALYYVDQAVWGDESVVIEGRNVFNISDNANLESRVSYNRYQISPKSRYVWPDSPNTLFYDDYKFGVGSGARLEEVLNVRLTEKFEVMAGFEADFFNIMPKATVPGGANLNGNTVAEAGSFSYYTVLGDPSSLVQVPRATDQIYQDFGYFVQGRLAFTDELSLTAGARIDHNTHYSEVPVCPRVAVIYHNTEQTFTCKYIYAQAFVGPAPYFAYNVFENGIALNTTNPSLSPETGTSHEIYMSTTSDKLLLAGSVYFNSQQNLFQTGDMMLPENIVRDTVYLDLAGTQTRVLTHSANGGNSKAIGTDLWARYKYEDLSYWASYSYVYFESLVDDVYSGLPMLSAHNVRLGVTWQAFKGFTITPSVTYSSTPQGLFNTDGLAGDITDPYEFNLFMMYTPRKNLDLFAEFHNLTDHHYVLKGIFGPMPQDTLRISGGMRYSF